MEELEGPVIEAIFAADVLQVKAGETNSLEDIDAALQAFRHIVDLLDEASPMYSLYQLNIGAMLNLRSDHTQSIDEMEQAISQYNVACALSRGTEYHTYVESQFRGAAIEIGRKMHTVGEMALYQFLQGPRSVREVHLLERAVAAFRAIESMSGVDALLRKAYLARFGVALKQLYLLSPDKDITILHEGISKLEAAQSLCDSPSTDRAYIRNDLGVGYFQQYRRTGEEKDIAKSLSCLRSGLEDLILLDSTQVTSEDLALLEGSLTISLLSRYKSTHLVEDLDDAILHGHQCLANPNSTNFAPRVITLCEGLVLKYHNLKTSEGEENKDILNECSRLLAQALDGPPTPREVHAANLVSQLGNVQYLLGDKDGAATTYRKALQYEGPEIFWGSAPSQNLHAILVEKAMDSRQPTDNEAAMASQLELDKLIPHMGFGAQWHARLIKARFYEHLYRTQPVPDFEDYGLISLTEYLWLVYNPLLDAQNKIRAAMSAADLVIALGQDVSVARDLLVMATELLPEGVPLASKRLVQLKMVRDFHTLPEDAVALFLLTEDDAAGAVQLLERSRGLIQQRLLDARSSLDLLRSSNTELAKEYERVSTLLSPSPGNTVQSELIKLKPDEAYLGRIERQQLASQYKTVLENVRALPGLHDFLRLPAAVDLVQECASHGPIVYVNVSKYGSHAIIINTDKVFAVPLPLFTHAEVLNMAEKFGRAKYHLGEDQHTAAVYKEVMKWIWDHAAATILDNSLPASSADQPGLPRIFWVASGWIGVLPIHAAGDFSSTSKDSENGTLKSSVQQRVCSTYISSIRALQLAREKFVHSDPAGVNVQQKALLVGMPTTPKEGDLPGVVSELKAIEGTLGAAVQVEKLLNMKRDEVQKRLSDSTIAHFACHGSASFSDPSQSMLLFQDWQKNSFNVRTLLRSSFKKCELAYLSACETSLNEDPRLRDESMHLAGGFGMAGVPHVIAAFWPVDDGIAKAVARQFYKLLKDEHGRLDTSVAARALHGAVEFVRSEYGNKLPPQIWGPFSHFGA